MQAFAGAPSSHGWEHTERVFNLCMRIGPMEGGDLVVLRIASYLHDVGRPFQDASRGTVCHAEKGAAIATSLLAGYPLEEERKRNIIHCVRSHRFRGAIRPETLEARILFDADKLDSIGAIGIARAFLFAGEIGARLHNPEILPEETNPYTREDTGYREFKLKLGRIKDQMTTSEGRKMARKRHAFMDRFFQRFLQEHEGKV